jgi:serpin B
MRRSLRLSPAPGIALLLAACSDGSSSNYTGPDAGARSLVELRSSRARLDAAANGEQAVSEDLGAFAWDFSRELADPRHNFVYSPYSIAVSAAMLSAGAEEATLTGIQSALGFRAVGVPLHEGYNALAQELSKRTHAGTRAYNPQELRVSNDFWMAEQLEPRASFLDTLAAYYGAGVFLAPFASRPDAAREAINAQIEQQTSGLIRELLPAGSVERATRFVLTNSLYLRAFWASQFSAAETRPAPFTTLDGDVHDVDTMHQPLYAGYMEGDGFIALSLAYQRSELELILVVPALGQFSEFLQSFDAEQARATLGSLQSTYVQLALPKFSLEYEAPLRAALSERGMSRAFSRSAEFDPIDSDAFLTGVYHRVTFAIDERGTIAAAATASGGGAGPPPLPIRVSVDRPFVFFIRDRPTDAVLFLGHVVTLPQR